MTLPHIGMEGRVIGDDPSLQYGPTGVARASFRVGAFQQKKNPQTGEWEDDKSFYGNVTVFGKSAEHVAASVRKGDTVVVSGKAEVREFTKRDDTKGQSVDIIADHVGVSLRWSEVTSKQAQRPQAGAGSPTGAAPDPWSTATSHAPDEAPF